MGAEGRARGYHERIGRCDPASSQDAEERKDIMFEKGVKYYTKGKAEIYVRFPEDQVFCQWCRFCRRDEMGRHWCRLTNEMIADPWARRGQECPVELEA